MPESARRTACAATWTATCGLAGAWARRISTACPSSTPRASSSAASTCPSAAPTCASAAFSATACSWLAAPPSIPSTSIPRERPVAEPKEPRIVANAHPHAAIVGGGIMGCDIGAIFAAGGWQVHVMSPSQTTRGTLPDRLRKALAGLEADPGLADQVQTWARLEDIPWPQVDIVIEAVTEDLPLKQQLFARLEELARPDIPLATNTSSYPIGE